MKSTATLLLCILLTFNYSHAGITGSVPNVVRLADSLKATLTATQLSTLQLPYSYSSAQTWSNLPTTFQARLGLKFANLTAAQLGIVKILLQEISGKTVNEGYDEASQLWLADDYLGANGGGTASYGAGLYYICFIGTPTLTGTFEIQSGGHHLAIANTYNNGLMVGATPHFEAVEPLSFTTGGTTYAPITQEKNAFAAMFTALSTTELATAKLTQTFGDVLLGAANGGTAKDWLFPTTKVGLPVGTLSTAQKQLVMEAIKTYVLDVDSFNSAVILAQYQNQLNDTYIAYSGTSTLATRNDYVRIDGPGVWIEFTVQGGIVLSGVHYHSIWRDHIRDFGGTGSTAGMHNTQIGSDTALIVLPIAIESTAVFKINESKVSVNWKTAYEINNNHFEIEYSSNGTAFTTIASINSKNNLQGSSYNYIHANPQKGINYYRIKSVDNDGKLQYSNIYTVTFSNKSAVNIYPNPVRDKLIVSHNLEGSQIAYTIYDFNGKMVLSKTAGNTSTFNIDVSNLPSGLYALAVNNEAEIIQSKFIKQ